MGNIIKAAVGKNSKEIVTAELHQYDYGQILKIEGITLPTAYQVHFSNEPHGSSTTSIGTADGVLIPDAYLQSGADVYAWLYLHEGEDDGETVLSIRIPVIARAEITNETPSTVEQGEIDELIIALNMAVDAAEDAEAAAEASAEAIQDMDVEASTLAAGSSATVTKTVDPETGAMTLSFGIPKGDTGAQGPAGVDGQPGADGQDGQDGTDATPDLITVVYDDLTFPVSAGTLCYHGEALYKANQDISTSESWTAAHWTETTVETELNSLKSAINGLDEAVSAAPTEETGLLVIDELNEENDLLETIKNGLSTMPTETTMNGIGEKLDEENGLLDKVIAGISRADLADNVPVYFRQNLEDAIKKYRANEETTGNDGNSFIFITDTHWGSNTKHSPDLIRFLVKNTNLRNVICGGDILDSGSVNSEMGKGYDFMDRFTDVPGGLKVVIGNHDWNKINHTGDSSYWLSKGQVYSMFYPKAEMEMQDFQYYQPEAGMYEFSYYVDVPSTNTRLLFISIPYGSVYTATVDWAEELVQDNPTKNFILFSHYLYNADSGEYPGGASNLIYHLKTYSNIKAWFFGHIHNDLVLYTSTGIPLVATDTDSSRLSTRNQYSYTAGTITEQAFDIATVDNSTGVIECVRVGRGKDRRINSGLNEIAVAGTHTFTPTISANSWVSSDTDIATVSNGTVTGVSAGRVTITAVGKDKEESWCIKVSS